MRVLHVINSLDLGGAETLISNLLPELEKLGIGASVWTLCPGQGPLVTKVQRSSARLLHSPAQHLYSPGQILRLAQHLSQNDYDVIHSHLFPAQLFVPMAMKLAGRVTPLVTTEHSTFNRRRTSIFRVLDRWMYQRYQTVICISTGVKDSLHSWLGSLESDLIEVRNGIPLEQFETAYPLERSELGPNLGGAIVLMVGSFTPQKDQETLIHAVSRLPNVHLLLVGDGPRRDAIRRLVQELGLASRVHLLGHRDDVARIMKAADVYVQSSHWEGFGIAAVEAMAAGCSVLATDVPGLREIVAGAGLLFPVGDVGALERKLRRILEEPTLRDEIKWRGVLRAREFSIEVSARMHAELYMGLRDR